MKPLLRIACCVILLLAVSLYHSLVYATTFSVVDSSNSIHGSLLVSPWTGSGWVTAYDNNYNLASSAPVSGGVSYLSYYANSHASPTDVYATFCSWANTSDFAVAGAWAQTITTFTPAIIGGTTPINFVGAGGGNWHAPSWVEIQDLTTGQKIFSTPQTQEGFPSGVQTFSYPDWTLNHVYQLTMNVGYGDSFMIGWNEITNDLSFVAIPEPTTLLLVVLGFVGLAGARRKFRS